ncbi:MAG: fructose-bisphosphatase class III [Ruthenibacterium lactatiformans]
MPRRCTGHGRFRLWPKLVEEGEYTPVDLARTARMHKAIAVMLFKLECALIGATRFRQQGRALLEQVDFVSQTIVIDAWNTT